MKVEHSKYKLIWTTADEVLCSLVISLYTVKIWLSTFDSSKVPVNYTSSTNDYL